MCSIPHSLFVCEQSFFLLQAVNKIDAYTQTRVDPKEIVDLFKKRFLVLHMLSTYESLTIEFEEF